MRKIIVSVIFVASLAFPVVYAGAADKPAVAAKAAAVETKKAATSATTKEAQKTVTPAAAEVKKEMTKEDYIKSIGTTMDSMQEIKGLVPGLNAETGTDGKNFYTYEGAKLEDLDKEKLENLYSRVMSEASRLRTDRLTRQLDAIRRTEQLNRQTRELSKIQRMQKQQTQMNKTYRPPVQAPKVYTPPKTQKTYYAPPTSTRR